MDKQVSIIERYHIFFYLMLSGGFMGAYSYYLKGGVFANAETANLLVLALSIATGDSAKATAVLFPITTFFLGTFFCEMLKSKLKKAWPKILVLCEIILLTVLAFLPESTSFSIFHVVIALISSMQYNTFKAAHGVPLSTLFCTAHMRGGASALYLAIEKKDRDEIMKFLYHTGLILTFIAGAFLCALISRQMGSMTIILCDIPLIITLFEISRK